MMIGRGFNSAPYSDFGHCPVGSSFPIYIFVLVSSFPHRAPDLLLYNYCAQRVSLAGTPRPGGTMTKCIVAMRQPVVLRTCQSGVERDVRGPTGSDRPRRTARRTSLKRWTIKNSSQVKEKHMMGFVDCIANGGRGLVVAITQRAKRFSNHWTIRIHRHGHCERR